MGKRPSKKKKKKQSKSKMSQPSTNEILARRDYSSEERVILKVTVRKGARIESVPLKKLEKLAGMNRRSWKFEKKSETDWLILFGSP